MMDGLKPMTEADDAPRLAPGESPDMIGIALVAMETLTAIVGRSGFRDLDRISVEAIRERLDRLDRAVILAMRRTPRGDPGGHRLRVEPLDRRPGQERRRMQEELRPSR